MAAIEHLCGLNPFNYGIIAGTPKMENSVSEVTTAVGFVFFFRQHKQ